MITVTKPYLPPRDEFINKVNEIFDRGILTNQGPNVKELESKLKQYLNIKNLDYVTNGTIALQFALEALNLNHGEIITTPFSYVATCSSILWQKFKPVFVDIELENFTLDPSLIESKITDKTVAIMPVHVFGYACKIEEIECIAKKHDLKVIYDAAHAFGSCYKQRSLVSYGDISTLSFHATKLFHTIEGGACVCNLDGVEQKLDLIKRFGHNGDLHLELGINGKQDEFNAAMGIVNLSHIDEIICERKKISDTYDLFLDNCVGRPLLQKDLSYNYAYYPVVFSSEDELKKVFVELEKIGVYPRRYFYPSLNLLPYVDYVECPRSEDLSTRIACLPLYFGLSLDIVKNISENIKKSIRGK